MAWLPLLRLTVLSTSVLFSIIVIGLAGNLIHFTTYWWGYYYVFSALSLATAVLTLITLPVMIAVDFMRTGAFTSKIVVELVWLFFLWVLWIASAGMSASAASTEVSGGCNYIDSDLNTACREISAITAFDFIIWFLLSAYMISLLVIAIRGHQNGAPVWSSSVKEHSAGAGVPSEKQTYPTTTYVPAATQPPAGGHPYNTPQPAQGTYTGGAPAQYPPQGAAQV